MFRSEFLQEFQEAAGLATVKSDGSIISPSGEKMLTHRVDFRGGQAPKGLFAAVKAKTGIKGIEAAAPFGFWSFDVYSRVDAEKFRDAFNDERGPKDPSAFVKEIIPTKNNPTLQRESYREAGAAAGIQEARPSQDQYAAKRAMYADMDRSKPTPVDAPGARKNQAERIVLELVKYYTSYGDPKRAEVEAEKNNLSRAEVIKARDALVRSKKLKWDTEGRFVYFPSPEADAKWARDADPETIKARALSTKREAKAPSVLVGILTRLRSGPLAAGSVASTVKSLLQQQAAQGVPALGYVATLVEEGSTLLAADALEGIIGSIEGVPSDGHLREAISRNTVISAKTPVEALYPNASDFPGQAKRFRELLVAKYDGKKIGDVPMGAWDRLMNDADESKSEAAPTSDEKNSKGVTWKAWFNTAVPNDGPSSTFHPDRSKLLKAWRAGADPKSFDLADYGYNDIGDHLRWHEKNPKNKKREAKNYEYSPKGPAGGTLVSLDGLEAHVIGNMVGLYDDKGVVARVKVAKDGSGWAFSGLEATGAATFKDRDIQNAALKMMQDAWFAKHGKKQESRGAWWWDGTLHSGAWRFCEARSVNHDLVPEFRALGRVAIAGVSTEPPAYSPSEAQFREAHHLPHQEYRDVPAPGSTRESREAYRSRSPVVTPGGPLDLVRNYHAPKILAQAHTMLHSHGGTYEAFREAVGVQALAIPPAAWQELDEAGLRELVLPGDYREADDPVKRVVKFLDDYLDALSDWAGAQDVDMRPGANYSHIQDMARKSKHSMAQWQRKLDDDPLASKVAERLWSSGIVRPTEKNVREQMGWKVSNVKTSPGEIDDPQGLETRRRSQPFQGYR